MEKLISITKSEAQAMLIALDWCECSFKLGKRQQVVREKLLKAFWGRIWDAKAK